jgi:hypothetical protein
MPAASPPSLSRRALLAGTLAAVAAPAVLGGCSSEPEPAAPTPDETALDFAVTSAEALIAAYAATASAHPALAPRLAPLAADHREHVAVLATDPSPTPSVQGSSSPTPVATPAPVVPAEPAAAVAALAASEAAAAAALSTRLGPIDADLARTLASVSACRTAHAADLGGAL